jgi:MOSC domain-containing protein YiiM
LNILLLECLEVLQSLGYRTSPGSFGEQIIVQGLPLNEMISGDRLRLGPDVVVEITRQRTGCERLEAAQAKATRLSVAMPACWPASSTAALSASATRPK